MAKTRRQHGGAGFGYTAPAGIAAGGVPFENRASYEVCADARVAPTLSAADYRQFGGGGCCGSANPPYAGQQGGLYRRRRSARGLYRRRQSGGGLYRRRRSARGLYRRRQSGGGSGTGGYGFVLNNEMGKVYADVVPGPCPVGQRGGSAAGSPAVLSSYSAGYGFGNPYSTPSGSAHFFEQQPYDAKTCMGGGRRKTKRHSRKTKTHKA